MNEHRAAPQSLHTCSSDDDTCFGCEREKRLATPQEGKPRIEREPPSGSAPRPKEEAAPPQWNALERFLLDRQIETGDVRYQDAATSLYQQRTGWGAPKWAARLCPDPSAHEAAEQQAAALRAKVAGLEQVLRECGAGECSDPEECRWDVPRSWCARCRARVRLEALAEKASE